jgi:hypothetical protein
MLFDDPFCNQGIVVYHVAALEECLETVHVDRCILNTIDIIESGKLGQTAGQRSLPTLKTCTLAATGTGLLSIVATR